MNAHSGSNLNTLPLSGNSVQHPGITVHTHRIILNAVDLKPLIRSPFAREKAMSAKGAMRKIREVLRLRLG